MSSESQPPEAARPPRDDPLPESYALRVTDGEVHVWQYNPTISEPAGEWQYVETIDQANAPRFRRLECPKLCGSRWSTRR